ncbi:hypothetical protein D0Y65_023090 [Glycine soja]|uniref:Uncharacterized protein n=1 Tax=Glycine soja TaxID=3848 RepID=A0A445IWE2_GLYSO|nr:hypothetical protein D0Y65_023090 [Glycine soja]
MSGGSNNGTINSFNKHGNGNQNFACATLTINSGANSCNRNSYSTANHYGGHIINNSGTFSGNGNGSFIEGGFNSTTNYHR